MKESSDGRGRIPAAREPGRRDEGVSGARCLLRGLAAQPQRGEAGRVDEVAGIEPGGTAAATGVEVLQGSVPGRGPQELTDLGQRVRQAGEPCRVLAAGHDAGPGVVPNPAQAEVPGWTEYASSAATAGPSGCPVAW